MILALAFPDATMLPIHASPSPVVLAFAFVLSLFTGIVFGVVPAWITSHSDPAEALHGVNRATRDHASLPQKSLIVVQAALSLVLLVGAGLLMQSLRHLEHQNFGIATANTTGLKAADLPGITSQTDLDNANRLYALFLPPGVTVARQGSRTVENRRMRRIDAALEPLQPVAFLPGLVDLAVGLRDLGPLKAGRRRLLAGRRSE